MSDILDRLKKDMVENVVQNGKRLDNRRFDEYRRISVKKGVLEFADGSALAKVGKTQVLAAVKFGIETPFPDRPTEGVLSVSAEFLPLASASFEPGPPDENAVELARVVDRGIRAANVIDLKSFFLEEGKVLGIYIDIYILDHYGNLIDAAALAAMAAITNTRIPRVENGAIVWGDYVKPLDYKGIVTTSTFYKVNGEILLDADRDEEKGASARVTISVMDGNVVAIQKSLNGSVTLDEFDYMLETALKTSEKLKAVISE